MTADPRAIVAAGGTGGHFYPGLVLAQTLTARGWQVLILTRRADPNLGTLEAEGIAYAELDLAGFPRMPSFEWLRVLRQTAASVGLATRIMRSFRPAVVIGMGGYLTFPAVAAAARLGVPRAVHDSNSVLGLANRAAVGLGAELFWGLPPWNDRHGTVTGTPIRPRLWAPGERGPARAKLGLSSSATTLLVFGGSQGAGSLNRCLPQALARTLERGGSVQVAHLAGRREAAQVRSAYAASGVTAAVFEYVSDMETVYAAADLVVSRAGASTLAELAACAKPAILVPYPHASLGHQTQNALVFSRAGAAVMVPDEALEERLPGLLRDLLLSAPSGEILERMSGAYAKLGLPGPEETARRLADAVVVVSGIAKLAQSSLG
ncbi:MAG: UDP-N-acetylglucosamine--N-acetylmuramyl-(pentapeptide) pyrophosphoryl-undecaprenol N-acetylglucosamine transferase [Elusimicrobia bacterium]|nr:UDP-N-acetylglucosamine--N-acetylmuramyl-(pentapeptide) pyrophosphoryl-undecaprenol N-acetylglucosamine transferase [Elusimicrobiota bacterium]